MVVLRRSVRERTWADDEHGPVEVAVWEFGVEPAPPIEMPRPEVTFTERVNASVITMGERLLKAAARILLFMAAAFAAVVAFVGIGVTVGYLGRQVGHISRSSGPHAAAPSSGAPSSVPPGPPPGQTADGDAHIAPPG